MVEQVKKLTRKEKIAAGIPKPEKRKVRYANELKDKKKARPGAILRDFPTSPRKMRLLVDQIRGQQVQSAFHILKHTTRIGAIEVSKLLKSAINNWQLQNEDLRIEDSGLFVKEVFVDEGRTLKRFRPAPQGRAYRIRKRSNHVTIILGTKEA